MPTLSDAQKALKTASSDIHGVASDARRVLKNTDSQLKPLTNKMEVALTSAHQALVQAKNTLATVNGFIGERSDTRHKLNRTLDEIGAAASSLHSFMDYLERHPEALLQGKGGSGR